MNNPHSTSDPSHRGFISRSWREMRALARAAVFFLKVFPMLPSRPVDWVTQTPRIEKVTYPSLTGLVEGEVYRPPGSGPYPGMLVCLGVVPFGVDHPQVAVLGRALARAGIAALLYWSPAMRDYRLDPADNENIPLAYRWLTGQPYIDPARCGMLGTCVGGAFALMASASPLARDRVAYIGAYAPFSSMWTFAGDIASASRDSGGGREAWQVDPLTRKVFVHSLTAWLEPPEASRLRRAFPAGREDLDGDLQPVSPQEADIPLSPEGHAVAALLSAPDFAAARHALGYLPEDMQDRLSAMSPLGYLEDVRAPLVVVLHDAGDQVIPVGESRRLVEAFAGRAGLRYTEMNFSHLDPVKGKLPLAQLARELFKFFRAVHPMFRVTTR